MIIQPLICNSCGGQVDRDTLTCKSCGIQYTYDNVRKVLIETSRPYITLEGKITVPSIVVKSMNETNLTEMTLHELATNLVPKIMPLIEYVQNYDPRRQELTTYGRLRVMNPKSNIDYIRNISEV